MHNMAQQCHLQSLMVGENLNRMTLPYALRGRPAVMELIEKLFGIKMPIPVVGECHQRWVYSPQRPSKRALEQNPAQMSQ